MSADSFRFQQFLVNQHHCAMKVGTDGVILGAWARVDDGVRDILDVGTGTGLIAMMLAQRASGANVDAVEIDIDAAQEAAENFKASPFSDRLRVYNIDFQSFSKGEGGNISKKYDLIVSNPPFFNGTYKSNDIHRTAARHCELLSLDDLLCGVVNLLSCDGRFAAIFPFSDAAIFITKASFVGLYCTEVLEVYAKPGKPAKRMVLEFSFNRTTSTRYSKLLITNHLGLYTDDYKHLTGDFYLRF